MRRFRISSLKSAKILPPEKVFNFLHIPQKSHPDKQKISNPLQNKTQTRQHKHLRKKRRSNSINICKRNAGKKRHAHLPGKAFPSRRPHAACSNIHPDKAVKLYSYKSYSYTAIKAIQRIKPDSTLIVVAETAHKKNWEEEFIKAGEDYKKCNVLIECYASLKNYKHSYFDLIIFDEAHHLGSEIRLDVLSSMKAQRVLALSATLSDVDL